MKLSDDNAYILIGTITEILADMRLKAMEFPKGSLSEPHRTQINGMTIAYVKLANRILDRTAADVLIHSLYFDFEKPVSEYLGFTMTPNLPFEYLMMK